tara:strand:+ start:1075 stop:1299 length:225 start_codon:yes stop_codon:yes gene_type:complete
LSNSDTHYEILTNRVTGFSDAPTVVLVEPIALQVPDRAELSVLPPYIVEEEVAQYRVGLAKLPEIPAGYNVVPG